MVVAGGTKEITQERFVLAVLALVRLLWDKLALKGPLSPAANHLCPVLPLPFTVHLVALGRQAITRAMLLVLVAVGVAAIRALP